MITEVGSESENLLSKQNALLELSMKQDGSLRTSKIPFAWKLHTMLEDTEITEMEYIVSWVNSGMAFKVHHLDAFMEKVVPFYFRQSKWKSFQRQLYFYGYTRTSCGAYQHPNFLKGNKTLSLSMRPTKIKSKAAKRMPDCSTASSLSSSFSSETNSALSLQIETHRENNHNTYKDEPTYCLTRTDKILLNGAENPTMSTHASNLCDGDRLFVFGGKFFHYVLDYNIHV